MKLYIYINNQFTGNSLLEFLVSHQMETTLQMTAGQSEEYSKEYSTKNMFWVSNAHHLSKGGYDKFVPGAFGSIDVIPPCAPACLVFSLQLNM